MSIIQTLPILAHETVLALWHSQTVRCGVDIKAFADAIIAAANEVLNTAEVSHDEIRLNGHNSSGP